MINTLLCAGINTFGNRMSTFLFKPRTAITLKFFNLVWPKIVTREQRLRLLHLYRQICLIHSHFYFQIPLLNQVIFLIKTINFRMLLFALPPRFKSFLPQTFMKFFSLSMYLLVSRHSISFFQQSLYKLFVAIPVFSHTTLTWFLRKYFRVFFSQLCLNYPQTFSEIKFSIRIAGKLGVAGNSRKRKFTFNYGLRLDTKQKMVLTNNTKHFFFLIPTFTGVLGVKIFFTHPS